MDPESARITLVRVLPGGRRRVTTVLRDGPVGGTWEGSDERSGRVTISDFGPSLQNPVSGEIWTERDPCNGWEGHGQRIRHFTSRIYEESVLTPLLVHLYVCGRPVVTTIGSGNGNRTRNKVVSRGPSSPRQDWYGSRGGRSQSPSLPGPTRQTPVQSIQHILGPAGEV